MSGGGPIGVPFAHHYLPPTTPVALNQVFEVPLVPVPQSFLISLSSVTYKLNLYWCWPAACWMLNVYDDQGNERLLGCPLVTGSDLLAQFEYLGIPGHLTVQTDHDTLAMPTFTNLGVEAHLYYIPFEQGT
jgi:hypothetical protein